jgi:hypothetical protein
MLPEEEKGRSDPANTTPWLHRFELDAAKMTGRGLGIEKIDNVLQAALAEHQVDTVRHQDADYDPKHLPKLVLRLRLAGFAADEDDETVPMLLKRAEDTLLNELTLQGFPEIAKVAYSKEAP